MAGERERSSPPSLVHDVGPQETADAVDPVRSYPVKCCGIELLAFAADPCNAKTAADRICVHQLALELWKRYDTPRATIQKTIEKLEIKLQNFNKEQILTLRKEGIVDGYRATAITVDEAEKVFDALEESRKRRGIKKHQLLTSPKDRNFRREEMKLKKKHLKRQLRLAAATSAAAASRANGEERGALNRTVVEVTESPLSLEENAQTETSKPGFDILLVAEKSYQLPDLIEEEELRVKLVENVALRIRGIQHNSSMDRTPLTGNPAPGGSTSAKDNTDSRVSESIGNMDLSSVAPELVSRIRSPSAQSSDQDGRASHQSFSRSSTRETTPNKSSPERFLFLESEESDGGERNPGNNSNQNNHHSTGPTCTYSQLQYRGIPHKGKGIGEAFGGGSSGFEEKRGTAGSAHQFSGLKHRRVKATKLRHYAKTTSPASTAAFSTETQLKQSSLVVSISLLCLPYASSSASAPANSFGKQRRPTALSHFATKKRALSRSPSVGSNHDVSPIANELDLPSTSVSETELKSGASGKCVKQPKKSTNNKTEKLSDQATPLIEQSPADEGPETHAQLELNAPLLTDTRPEIPVKSLAQDDDEMSVASSATTTTTTTSSSCSSAVGASDKPTTSTKPNCPSQRGRKSSRGAHNNSNSLLRINTQFSLQSLFGGSPPRLTVRDGELVPERSLSLKGLDQFSVPASHPINNWSIGQPVPGRWTGVTSAPRAKRPRKMTNHSSKL